MRKLIYITSIVFAVLILSGCTHNNGNIGPWWGQWKIEKIEQNGEVLDRYEGNYFFRFQSSSVAVVRSSVETENISGSSNGHWLEENSTLRFEFLDDKGIYQNIFLDKSCRLDVIKRDGREKILEFKKDDKTVYAYYLKAW